MNNPDMDNLFTDALRSPIAIVLLTIINIGFVCPALVSASNWPAVIGGFALAFANVWWIARRLLRISL